MKILRWARKQSVQLLGLDAEARLQILQDIIVRPTRMNNVPQKTAETTDSFVLAASSPTVYCYKLQLSLVTCST